MICFHFTIFVVLETTSPRKGHACKSLWFAFILLSLSYWKQPEWPVIQWETGCDLLSFYYLCRTGNNKVYLFPFAPWVVICFHFTIFVVLETTEGQYHAHYFCCDLLSFYYLCRTGNNLRNFSSCVTLVVICFHFTIFVVLETTQAWKTAPLRMLWFAFILLSLSYWKQRMVRKRLRLSCCDLLSFYYLCRTGNNINRNASCKASVVICFHFTIFVVLETTNSPRK